MKVLLCAYIPKGLQFHLDALQDLIHEQDARILQAALLLLHPLANLLKDLKKDEIVIKDYPDDQNLNLSPLRRQGLQERGWRGRRALPMLRLQPVNCEPSIQSR